MSLGVAIVGCGLMGRRRAAVVGQSPDCRLVAVADVDAARAAQVTKEHGCAWARDWREVVSREDVDAVIVCTNNKAQAPITIAAAQHGKHVLCEKPLGRNLEEAGQMVEAAKAAGVVLKPGFNHRYHPAVRKAHDLCLQGAIGPLIFVRSVYGHGGRPGYHAEWRGDADLAGGGELLDQGVHIIDLCRWFLGEFVEVMGYVSRWYWDIAPLEDNGFALMRTRGGQIASLHTSWTQWKNRFSFEVFGRDGYLAVEGLGGSYGPERLTWGRRRPESGPPDEQHFEFDSVDRSWHEEWSQFVEAVKGERPSLADAHDGLQAQRLVDALYRSARTGQAVQP